MKLSELDALDDFALLGPGYSASATGEFTLLTSLRRGEGDATVWYAPYEAPGREAVRLRGDARRVHLELEPAPAGLRWTLDEGGFLSGVEQIRAAIAAGDVYQVNLTLRAEVACGSGAALLSALCRRGVPRFAAWLKVRGVGELVSASPELLCSVEGGLLRAEPMKGTAGPGRRAWLEASEKDRAELAMITDLLRDDLHHLCVPRSVAVPCARRFLELPYAVQAVSDVEGRLREGVTLEDVLAQLHPGGSVTGAPRPAARAFIALLEPRPRGAYCGALGLEAGGRATIALLIRTAERVGPEAWRYGVGSGITWDSEAAAELEEVRLKLGALE